MSEPPKFVKDPTTNVKKLNPAWKAWKDASAAPPSSCPAMPNEATALPVVTSVAEQRRLLPEVKPSQAVLATQEILHDSDVAAQVGCVDPEAGLAKVFAKYEVPMGLMNKLMQLSDFQFMEMIVDDSGSMNAPTDSKLPDGRPVTRWQEVHHRLTQMFELMVYVPCPPCYIRFLNRSDIIEAKKGDGESPQQYFNRIVQTLGQQWTRPPGGTTPALERIRESLGRCRGQSVLRYFFGDGQPNGGNEAAQAITQLLINRPHPEQNPFTFLSCTNEDAAVEWMKECEEAAPFCSEFDDYDDEAREVLEDQGRAFSYTFGMHVISQLVAAFNPHDLDALDESVPFTRLTLSQLLGYELDEPAYQNYHRHFVAALQAKPTRTKLDQLKKSFIPHWVQHYMDFFRTPQAASLPIVQQYTAAVLQLKRQGL